MHFFREQVNEIRSQIKFYLSIQSSNSLIPDLLASKENVKMNNFIILLIVLVAVACVSGFGFGHVGGGGGPSPFGSLFGAAPPPQPNPFNG
uniref:Transmembrane protein n=1 Tax=Plectus sambesii TaxID=2011161 RepID=A0A914XPG4_9BILA